MTTPSEPDHYDGYCTLCRVPIASFNDVECCPRCGTTMTPCGYDQQVNISVNWHELRCLVMYAEFYAKKIGKQGLIYAIAEDLLVQYPELAAENPLTFAGEVDLLRKEHPDVKVINSDGEIDGNYE